MPLRDPNRITVEEFMNNKPITVQTDRTLLSALEMMRKYNIQDIPVINSNTGRLAGILDRRQMSARRLITSTTMVEDLMSPPTRVSPTTTLPRVAEILLASDFRGLPVTYNNRMVGFISRRDIVRAIPHMVDVKSRKVEDMMSIDPMVVAKGDDIAHAVELMEELGQRCLPVVDEQKRLVGIMGKKALESREVRGAIEDHRRAVAKGARGRSPSKKTPRMPQVAAFMNDQPLTVERGDPLKSAVNHIRKSDISAVVVTEGDQPIGILSISDLMELVASRSARSSVYVQISGLPLEESPIYEDMEADIQSSMKRIARFTDPEMVTVHLVKHHGQDDEDKFTVRVRLNDTRKVYMTSAFDWDIMNALGDCLGHMETLVRKDHDKRLDKKRGARRTKKR